MSARDLSAEELPVDDLATALAHFRRPFAPEAIRFKVQSEWGSGALIVAYMDARLVVERLNAVAGAFWHDEYRDMAAGAAECALTVFGVTRRDVGTGGGFEQLKSTRSDALKRAAVKFGIGVSVYAMAQVRLDAGEKDSELRKRPMKKKNSAEKVPTPFIDDRTEAWLRGVYAKWLEKGRGSSFGPALEHGDEAGSQGLESDQGIVAAVEDEAAVALDDEHAQELVTCAREAFAELRKVAPRAMLPGAFEARLTAAATSHETLEALVDELLAKAAASA